MASRRRSAGKCVLCGSVGTCLKEGCEHMHTGIANFDVFTSTRWILQPEDKHGEVKHHLDIVRVVKDMREFLLANELYLTALEDLHAGLMADLAGRWYCDYYELHGTSGYFTGNNIGRYIADILNPYAIPYIGNSDPLWSPCLPLLPLYRKF